MISLGKLSAWIGSIVLLAGVALAKQPAIIEIEDCDCSPRCIENYVTLWSKGEYTEKEADRLSNHCGEKAVAPLRKLVSSVDASTRSKGFALLCLGKIGTPDCETALIDYIQLSRTESVSLDEYVSMQMALYGLGFIGSERAIEFLRLLCSEEYWKNRGDIAKLTTPRSAETAATPSFGIDTWRSSALAGIGAMEPAKALKEFERLRRDESHRALFHSIDGAITATKKEIDAK